MTKHFERHSLWWLSIFERIPCITLCTIDSINSFKMRNKAMWMRQKARAEVTPARFEIKPRRFSRQPKIDFESVYMLLRKSTHTISKFNTKTTISFDFHLCFTSWAYIHASLAGILTRRKKCHPNNKRQVNKKMSKQVK